MRGVERINADELQHFRGRLQGELEELRDLASLGGEAAETVVLDQPAIGRLSRMDALQGQAMAQASQQRRRGRLRAISAALARIESGDFGYCQECDEPIAAGRLHSDPAVALCITCANRREQG